MSRRACCVPGCSITSQQDVPLHQFPNPAKQKKLFNDWLFNIGGEILGLEANFIFKHRRVCHRHFQTIYHYPQNRINRRVAIPRLCLPGLFSKQILPSTSTDQPSCCGLKIDNQKITDLPSCAGLNIDNQKITDQPSCSGLKIDHQRITDEPSCYGHKLIDNAPAKPRSKAKARHTQQIINFKNLLKVTQYKIKKLEIKKDLFKKRLALAKKMQADDAFFAVSKKMTNATKQFVKMQITQSGKKPKGRRFTLDEKIMALSLYKPSPKAYKVLSEICVLPKRSTLQKLLTQIRIKPGINDVIFENLRKRVLKMPPSHKYCIVTFDEMKISTNIHFSRKDDKIIGFNDNGVARNSNFSDHVLVFMVRGVIKKYKQPISYSFCSGSTESNDLVCQIKNMLQKVKQTGLKVVATVCDQGSNNRSAINRLIHEAKEKYLRRSEEWRDDFFEIDEDKIIPLFDPPHLMKNIRNNLLNKNLHFELNGKAGIAKWAHIEELYTKRPGYKGVKMVSKLTARHVNPRLIPKMRVKFCTQVFSQRVGVALGFLAEKGHLPEESTCTADIVLFFDQLFDSVNGSFSQVENGKTYRAAVTPRSLHHKLWIDSLRTLKTMKYINADSKMVYVPSLSGWIQTIKGFQAIFKLLNSKGINSLLLRHFNQDSLENFFAGIRAQGVRNVMPDAVAFESAYKTLLVNNMSSSHSVGANCENDDDVLLQSLKYFFDPEATMPGMFDQNPITEIEQEHILCSTSVFKIFF